MFIREWGVGHFKQIFRDAILDLSTTLCCQVSPKYYNFLKILEDAANNMQPLWFAFS
jgi:hypothetical protein